MSLLEITDDDYEEYCDFDDYLQSLSEEELAQEEKWLDSIALAITQGKNVVPNPARHYDFMM